MGWGTVLAFGLGVVNSLLGALYYNLVGKDRAVGAAVLAVPVYGVSLFVINKVLVVDRSLVDALGYVVGCSVGTYLTTKFAKRIKRWGNDR